MEIEDLVDAASRLAARSPGHRLDPPLTLVPDEAANYPLPSLPALMSEGGGSGITTIAVCPSPARSRDRRGSEAAQGIWDAATVKLVLGGTAEAEDFADLSPRRPSELGRLGAGTGLLMLPTARPIMLRLRPWTGGVPPTGLS